MVMKPANSAQIQFRIRKLKVRSATDDEDYKGADAFLNALGLAHRGRSYHLTDFEEISIRKRDYSRSEYEKILEDECLADLWIFEFDDTYILCLTADIKNCLREGKGNYMHNKDEPNGAYYIHISKIPHLRIEKDKNNGNHSN